MLKNRPTGERCFNCFDLNGGVESCTKCGHHRADVNRDRRALPLGTLLGNKYLIGRILGAGGFGITYLGLDVSLNRRVAIKEYIPNELASRARDGTSIICNSPNDQEPFNYGLRKFYKEGEMIAKFDHPNIVRAYEVFESNGTAYLVMEFLEGKTLRAFLDSESCFPESKAIEILTFVFDALRVLHDRQVVHRDIKPDNVYLTTEGRTLLLDFGGAKEIVGEHSKSMTAIFSHGYAAPEQYLGDEAKAGPWTDVYGAAALLYRVITGIKPPSALERYGDNQPLNWLDKLVSASTRNAVERAMKLKPEDRTGSIRTFQKELEEKLETPEAVVTTVKQGTTGHLLKLVVGFIVTLLVVLVAYIYLQNSEAVVDPDSLKTVLPPVQQKQPNKPAPSPVTEENTEAAPKDRNQKVDVTGGKTSSPPRSAEVPKRIKSETSEVNSVPGKGPSLAVEIEPSRSNDLEVATEQRRKDDSNISSILEDGEACFQARKFDCAISSSNAALRIRDGDQRALSLKERAKADQEKALKSITIQ